MARPALPGRIAHLVSATQTSAAGHWKRRLSRAAIRVSVAVHAADVQLRRTSEGPEIVGGPLCQTVRWVPRDDEGFWATPAALADL